jgi:tRNA (guanine-N7-)-methyltransferase
VGLRSCQVLSRSVAEGSLDAICVFFPDPWPHTADAPRRIIRGEVVADMARGLRPGGLLHV